MAMATTAAAAAAAATTSSPSTHDPPAPTPPSTSSRRLPPPCWSHDETVALIDAYRDKWYSLRRGNLRANHWQEVADAIALRSPVSAGNPAKTSVQCRHKMEKLRKRYRSEIQRASNIPHAHRFSSSWVHFNSMDSMEKGPNADPGPTARTAGGGGGDDDDDDDDDFLDLFQNGAAKRGASHNRSPYLSNNGIVGGSSGGGFRIRIPSNSGSVPMGTKNYRNMDENPNPNVGYGSTRVLKGYNSDRFGLRKKGGGDEDTGKKSDGGDPVSEMVSAIKLLGDGFVRMEKMKMDMAREVEAMRMEMELKRTEMILESQHRIVETFAKAFSDKNKKPKLI